MNAAFTLLTLISLVMLTVLSPQKAFPTLIEGVGGAVALAFKLVAVYAVWLSVLKMAEATGLDKKLSRGLRPLIRKLFKGESDDAYDHISVNLASNMLGMGGVATPAGIKAIGSMRSDGVRASDNMILLVVINATSIQLIPAAVIAIRAANGSADAADIFLPTFISTAVSTLSGILICKTLSLKDKHNKNDISYDLNSIVKPDFCKKFKYGRNDK